MASELVKRSNIDVWESKEFEFKPSIRCNLKIWLERLPEKFERYSWWIFIDNHVGISRPVNRIAIQDIVKNKATKLQTYKERYSEVMLLIVSDRTYESGMFHLNEEIVTPAYGFSAVYLVLYPENCIRIG